jgi:hypothetical protein
MKVNESKSSHITFTLRKRPLPCSQHQPNYQTSNRSSKIPRIKLKLQVELEITHRQERKQMDLRTKQINWLTGKKKSHLSIENKLLIYQAVIKPIWSYGIELWGWCQQVQHSHHAEVQIQSCQSHSKCTLLRNKPYSTYRLQHPLRK